MGIFSQLKQHLPVRRKTADALVSNLKNMNESTFLPMQRDWKKYFVEINELSSGRSLDKKFRAIDKQGNAFFVKVFNKKYYHTIEKKAG